MRYDGGSFVRIYMCKLLQSFSYDFNILDVSESEEDHLKIVRFAYEALHDGKTDELYDGKTDESKGTVPVHLKCYS